MLLFRVVSTPGSGKSSRCLYFSLLYLREVVSTPTPLGSPLSAPPFASSERPRNPHLHIVNRVNEPC